MGRTDSRPATNRDHCKTAKSGTDRFYGNKQQRAGRLSQHTEGRTEPFRRSAGSRPAGGWAGEGELPDLAVYTKELTYHILR